MVSNAVLSTSGSSGSHQPTSSRWGVLRLVAVAFASFALTSLYHREACLHSHARSHHRHFPGADPHERLLHPKHIESPPAKGSSLPPLALPPMFPPPPPPGDIFHGGALAAPAQQLQQQLQALPVFIIGLDEPETHWNVQRLAYVLGRHELKNVLWWNATDARHGLFKKDGIHWRTTGRSLEPGELGIRDSFRRLFLHAWHSGIERFIVLEDDVTPHCDLGNRLARLLQAPECGGWGSPTDTKGSPGAFMLGATCYAVHGMNISSDKSCYPAQMSTYGAFAVMYRRDSIPAILHWIATSYLPLDNIWAPLHSHPPFKVAVAFPNLFAPELDHTSTTQPGKTFDQAKLRSRYRQHRWERPDYCGWAYEFHPDTDWQSPGKLNPALTPSQGGGAGGAPQGLLRVPKAKEHGEALMLQLMLRLKWGIKAGQDPVGRLPVVIITLEPKGPGVLKLRRLLKSHGVTNVGIWQGTNGNAIFGDAKKAGLDGAWSTTADLRPGEMGVLQSHRDILKAAWFKGLERLLILEDDVIPHCNLGRELRAALEEELCGGLTLGGPTGQQQDNTTHPPGVLMLGATEYSKWPGLIEETLGRDGKPPRGCYTCNQGTYGAFAVVYSRRAIPYILRWMDEVPRPYDHIWHFLQSKKINVRVVFPNLFMPDIGHASLTNPTKVFSNYEVERRLQLHKWNRSLYCEDESGAAAAPQ